MQLLNFTLTYPIITIVRLGSLKCIAVVYWVYFRPRFLPSLIWSVFLLIIATHSLRAMLLHYVNSSLDYPLENRLKHITLPIAGLGMGYKSLPPASNCTFLVNLYRIGHLSQRVQRWRTNFRNITLLISGERGKLTEIPINPPLRRALGGESEESVENVV